MALLEVRGLVKWYGRRQVVCGVDYEVNRGEVVGLLGPNGAGKTTSFRMTIGLINADGGKVIFDGRDVTNLPMYLRARGGMGYLAQDSSVFKQLTVEDNLMAILETRKEMSRRQRKDRQNELLDQFGLAKIRRNKANRVSGGERRRLEIARSLITDPKLIMLDEPFAGIDPKTVIEIQDQIRSLVERYNIGILLTDHQFRETIQVTDRTYVIREGRVFAYGNREQIINNPEVRRHYIGERFDVGHLLDGRAPHAMGEPSDAPGSLVNVGVESFAPVVTPPATEPASLPVKVQAPVPDPAPPPALPPAPAPAPEPIAAKPIDEPRAAVSEPEAAPAPHAPPPMLADPAAEPELDYDPLFGSSVTLLTGMFLDPADLAEPPPAEPQPPTIDDIPEDEWPEIISGRPVE